MYKQLYFLEYEHSKLVSWALPIIHCAICKTVHFHKSRIPKQVTIPTNAFQVGDYGRRFHQLHAGITYDFINDRVASSIKLQCDKAGSLQVHIHTHILQICIENLCKLRNRRCILNDDQKITTQKRQKQPTAKKARGVVYSHRKMSTHLKLRPQKTRKGLLLYTFTCINSYKLYYCRFFL